MTEVTARLFHADSDYADIRAWWGARPGWSPIPAEMLPRTGAIVEAAGEKLCAGFLYADGCMGVLEWIVSNPEASPIRRVRAVEALIDTLLGIAWKIGVRRILSTTNNEALERLLVKHGFQVTERNVTLLIAGVN
jgi:hypothetical protein